MALAILDGTQTATTLSTILSSGQHITAHTVVSLGTQAKTDILSAVSSGIAISGTVTANVTTLAFTTQGGIASSNGGSIPTYGIQLGYNNSDGEFALVDFTNGYPITGSVAVKGLDTNEGQTQIAVTTSGSVLASLSSALPAGTNRIGVVTIGAGTVTIGAGTAQIGSVTASISGTVTANLNLPSFAGGIGDILTSAVQIGYYDDGLSEFRNVNSADSPLPISGTVVIGAALPAGTNLIGTVTANLSISSTAITSGSFASLTSATLVPGNTARKMATVFNQGAGQLFVNAGATATTLGGGFMVALSSGDYFECGFTTTTLSAIFATAGTASWVSH